MAGIELRAVGVGGGRGRRVDNAFVVDEQSAPTTREKRLVKVGWPEGGGGRSVGR